MKRIAVIGGGIIGLSCAWELVRRGCQVELLDPRPLTEGASWAAAGMLGPTFEAAIECPDDLNLQSLMRDSRAIWRDWAEELERQTSIPVGHSDRETLIVATRDDERDVIERVRNYCGAERDTRSASSTVLVEKSALSFMADVEDWVAIAGEGQIDNRAALRALSAACQAAGVGFRQEIVALGDDELQRWAASNGFDAAVVATGAAGLVLDGEPLTRPCRGQALSIDRHHLPLDYVVRFGSRYLVPKSDRIIIGATVEPSNPSGDIDNQTTNELIASVAKLFPELKSVRAKETWVGFRPMTRDDRPVIGRLGDTCLYLALGHFRNGILMAPITAKLIADQVLDRQTDHRLKSCSPDRFDVAAAVT